MEYTLLPALEIENKNCIFASEQIVVSVRSSSVRSATLRFYSETLEFNYPATIINRREKEQIKYQMKLNRDLVHNK